jgi:hypothetical protein
VADKTVNLNGNEAIPQKWVDTGDGFFAPRSVAVGANGVPLGGGAAALADRSGTITLGGTAQNAMAANTARQGFWVQNNSTGDLWINTLATAIVGQPSLRIPAGALYETPVGGVGTGAVSIIGATTAQAFSAREW